MSKRLFARRPAAPVKTAGKMKTAQKPAPAPRRRELPKLIVASSEESADMLYATRFFVPPSCSAIWR